MSNARDSVGTTAQRGVGSISAIAAKERKISEADLFALAQWKIEDPDVPDGDCYKDFGTFKLCGMGKFPNTFLLSGQVFQLDQVQTYDTASTLRRRRGYAQAGFDFSRCCRCRPRSLA